MYDVQVLIDKISGFETADEIAKCLKENNVKGYRQIAYSCAISAYFTDLGDKVISSSTCFLDVEIRLNNGERFNILCTNALGDFIGRFDSGYYPELEHEDQSHLYSRLVRLGDV